MEVEIIKEYIDIDNMCGEVLNILKEARDGFKDGKCDDFLDGEYSDEALEERALWQAVKWNDNMNKYLHTKDHRIFGNFNNVDYDYPHFRTGEFKYDNDMVNDMIKRLDDNWQDEQTQTDRKWLVDWFFDTFGTYNFKYNFQSEMSEAMYQWERENAIA